jgi:hypothetical protein
MILSFRQVLCRVGSRTSRSKVLVRLERNGRENRTLESFSDKERGDIHDSTTSERNTSQPLYTLQDIESTRSLPTHCVLAYPNPRTSLHPDFKPAVGSGGGEHLSFSLGVEVS